MRKELLVFVVGLCAIAALVFWRQVVTFFAGMTPFEAIEFIMTFALKSVVLAIISWLVYHLPDFIHPWQRAWRWKHKFYRRGRTQPVQRAPRAQRINKDVVLRWMAGQIHRQPGTKATVDNTKPEEPRIRFE